MVLVLPQRSRECGEAADDGNLQKHRGRQPNGRDADLSPGYRSGPLRLSGRCYHSSTGSSGEMAGPFSTFPYGSNRDP
jgi:hypothetical protein